MPLLTARHRQKLLANGRTQAPLRGTPRERDFLPVVRLFTPDACCTWLLTELEPDRDTAFGLCDLGMGSPELGNVSIRELERVRGRLGLPVEADRLFRASRTLSACAQAARQARRIVD